ncbi:hypothetical protein [Providencia rettgeri]|uniref:hypothetical protein n=1 Tax=Providencia rettgeri TaxID=587 RepID=UPI0032EF71AC
MMVFQIAAGLIGSTLLPLFFYFVKDKVNRQDKILEQPTSSEFTDFVNEERVRRQIHTITGVSSSVAQPIVVNILRKMRYEIQSVYFFKPINNFLSVTQIDNKLSIDHTKVKKNRRYIKLMSVAIIVIAIFLSGAIAMKSLIGILVFSLYLAFLMVACIAMSPPSKEIILEKEKIIKKFYSESGE